MTSGPLAPDPGSAPATGSAAAALPDPLPAELHAGPWDHPWPLAPGLVTPVGDPAARHAAWTLGRMIDAPVRDALAQGEGEAAALDLACGEGALAQAVLGLGARRVLALETRPRYLRRAELLRGHFGYRPEALELRAVDDLGSIDPMAIGRFDVVLLVGIFDRVEDTGMLMRLARACARTLCVIEAAGAEARSLAEAARGSGFVTVRRAPAPPDGEARYALGRRVVLLAETAETA